MDDMDGGQILKEMRQTAPAARVILVTSLKREDAQKLGADGYIGKPFNQNEIIMEINRVLGEKI
jgi:DNA-binding response OmpR family regulator